jgi:serine/threonine-protein kinase
VSAARAATPDQLRRRLRGDLDTIVLKAIRTEPRERYTSALGLSDDLVRHLEGKPVSARPDTPAYRARKFVGRNRVAVGAAAIVALSLAITTGVTLRQSARVQAESLRVARERDKAIQVKGFLL